MKFKVGDRVKSIANDKSKGMIGTVIEVNSVDKDYLCRFIGFNGHDGQIFSKKGGYDTCDHWYLKENEIESVNALPDQFHVRCKTDKKLVKVLEKADELGYKWRSGDGALRTGIAAPMLIIFEKGHTIAYSEYLLEEDRPEYPKVKYHDFITYEPQEPKFEKGKRYIFDRETFRKNSENRDYSLVRECDGKLVSVDTEDDGHIDAYDISPAWCKEVPEGEFVIGDAVKVIDTGKMYTTNVDMVRKIAKDDDVLAHFAYGHSPYTNDIKELAGKYIVIGIDGNYILIRRAAPWESKPSREVLLVDKKGLRLW